MKLRVFNYNTLDKVAEFAAHADYIRALAVHPSQPWVLSAGDDSTVKLWNWDQVPPAVVCLALVTQNRDSPPRPCLPGAQGWKNMYTYEGHTHYIMDVKFNPKVYRIVPEASFPVGGGSN
jgi:coatomer subunit beta'